MTTPAVLPRSKSAGQASSSATEPLPSGLMAPVAKSEIKILVVDDHPVVRQGLRSCLASHENFVVVGEAGDGQEALRKVRELLPDLVLMDINMPGLDGLAVTEVLHKELPHVKVLILSMHRNTEYVVRILQSGACGYVLKESSPAELVEAIHSVFAGQAFFSPEVARVALNQFVRGGGQGSDASLLTSREREVLIQIAKGLSNKEIATTLGLGVRTVETHREHIMNKLNIHSIAGLTRYAIAKGYVSL